MFIIRALIKIILVLLLIFFIGGYFIPDEWSVSRSIIIQAKRSVIYPYLSNFKKMDEWIPWNTSKDSTLKYTYEGPESGVGAKQNWTSEKMGTGWMQLTKADPKKGVAYDLFIDMKGSQSTLKGEIGFTKVDKDTKVTWTDRGNSNGSFGKRWMGLLLSYMLGKDMDTGLNSLKTLVEKK